MHNRVKASYTFCRNSGSSWSHSPARHCHLVPVNDSSQANSTWHVPKVSTAESPSVIKCASEVLADDRFDPLRRFRAYSGYSESHLVRTICLFVVTPTTPTIFTHTKKDPEDYQF